MEYVYTSAVRGVTYGIPDTDKLQATLQAARFFSIDQLDKDACKWAKQSGVTIVEAELASAVEEGFHTDV
jgi:hypothetical protein